MDAENEDMELPDEIPVEQLKVEPIAIVETNQFGKLLLMSQSADKELELYFNEDRNIVYIFFHGTFRMAFDLPFVNQNNIRLFFNPYNLQVFTGEVLFAIIPIVNNYEIKTDLVWAEGFDEFGTQLTEIELNG